MFDEITIPIRQSNRLIKGKVPLPSNSLKNEVAVPDQLITDSVVCGPVTKAYIKKLPTILKAFPKQDLCESAEWRISVMCDDSPPQYDTEFSHNYWWFGPEAKTDYCNLPSCLNKYTELYVIRSNIKPTSGYLEIVPNNAIIAIPKSQPLTLPVDELYVMATPRIVTDGAVMATNCTTLRRFGNKIADGRVVVIHMYSVCNCSSSKVLE